MQEHSVTFGGVTQPLPYPFHVLATQNPLEHEGTYPLPEAQLDRFLMQVCVEYPSAQTEKQIILSTTGVDTPDIRPVMDAQALLDAQELVRRLPAGERITEKIVALVQATRPQQSAHPELRPYIAWGAGPRAGQALMLSAKALALLDGRYAPSLEDVREVAQPVLGHRIGLTYQAIADKATINQIIEKLCDSILT
jgi:MoxR-like ATPase